MVKRSALLLGLAAVLASSSASASGLYLTDRGVRPLGRGGAFVAGADDLGAIWYNPAGLSDAGTSLLLDASLVNFKSAFTRRSNVTTAGGAVQTLTFPTVEGDTPALPIPTLAGSMSFGQKNEFTVALGVHAPYSVLARYPTTVDGRPAASRFSLVSLEGSALAMPGIYVAYKPSQHVRFGAGFQTLVGTFASSVVFSASPADRLISSPEDPQYDATNQLKAGPIVAPSGNLGLIVAPIDAVRLGVSGQLPFWIDAPAEVNVRLPDAPTFDRAKQEGNRANVRFKLPPIFRAGFELRHNLSSDAQVRGEFAYVREFWSIHDSIDVRPQDIRLLNVTGFPNDVRVTDISLPRNFKDSNSFRLGGELSMRNVVKNFGVDVRAGIAYDTSAIPPEWLTVLTYDANKVTTTFGLSAVIGEHLRLDTMGAIVMMDSVTVDPAEARVTKVNPVRGNPTQPEAINGGDYSAKAFVLGLGANYKF